MSTKIILSDEELKVLSNKDFLITKRNVSDKIILLLGELDEATEVLKQTNKTKLPAEALLKASKISRGENYLGLPFIILDNPRVFSGNDVFAFRTMFWWGNFISFTIHIGGKFFIQLKPLIPALLMHLKKHQIYVCINPHQWHHHFEKENLVLIDDYCNDEGSINSILQLNYLKLATRISLNEYEKICNQGIAFYELFFEKLGSLN